MKLTMIHFITLIATLLMVVGIGFYASRKVKTAADFSVGGNSAKGPLIAGTIVGTIIGGSATIGTAQLAFTVGFSALWYTVGAGLALLILGLFYAKPLRNSGVQTIPEFLVGNYGDKAGPLASLTSSVGIFFSIIANILAAMPLVTSLLGFHSVQAATLIFILVVVYVLFGGVWGAGLVGIFKTVLIYITLLSVGYLSFTNMGGVSGFVQAFPSYPWFDLFGRGYFVDIGAALSLIVGTLSTQTYVQAIYSARDVKSAKQGAVAAAMLTLPTGIPAVMVGLYMRAHYPDIAPIDALPLFITNFLPPWLGGIAIAALLLACIGSAAGLILGVSTMLTRDIISKMHPLSEITQLKVNRLLVLALSLGGVLFTFGNMKSLVLEWNFLSMGLRGAGIFLPLTAAVFFPGKIKAKWALLAIGAGASVSLVWKFIGIGEPLYAGLAVNLLLLLLGRGRLRKYSC